MIPIHWGLFALAPHAWTEPVERAIAAAAQAGVVLATPRPGESLEPAQAAAVTRWWPEVPWSPAEQTPIVSTPDGRKPRALSIPLAPSPAYTLPSHRWVQLQTELRDLAFVLDRRGSHAAADVATTAAARIGELLSEGAGPKVPGAIPSSSRFPS
jgi:hypothetical protein